MIGDSAFSSFVDSLFGGIIKFLGEIFEIIISIIFGNRLVALLIFFILINIITILLMKKDKEYAQNAERRIKENTLIIAALVGGGLGEYFAMYKYKHKTMHKKFLYGVPIAIMINVIIITYGVAIEILA